MPYSKYTIDDCYSVAVERNMKFLSTTYKRANDKYEWECGVEGHPVFVKSLTQIKAGQGCPRCRYDKVSEKLRGKNCKTGEIRDINYMKEFAKSKGGECLSDKYINNRTKLEWRCSYGHEWETVWSSVYLQGTWCPKCAGKAKTIKDCQEEAKNWGGKCLSTKYINSTTRMKYQCNNGHVFIRTPEQITAGSWCPECSSSIGERLTRGLLNRIFCCEFVKVRPEELRNEEGNKLELDGYNAEFKLAFEYQGKQHTFFNKHFHKNQASFEKRQRDDYIKKEWCKENGISLIEVPDYEKYSDLPSIINIVEECIKRAGVTLPEYDKPKTHGEILHSDLSKLKKICESNGGKVITDAFLGWAEKHKYECGKGHRWITTADAIKYGSWCKECSMKAMGIKLRKYSLKDAIKLAEEKNGKCLSKAESFTTSDALTWYCNIHKKEWEAPISRIISGGWCPICGRVKCDEKRKKYTIKDLQNLAAERGGKCLSSVCCRADDKYNWECAKGHKWDATFNDIKGSPKHKPTWCPYCAKKAKHTIEEMREWAAAQGGKCLSKEYIDAKTKLLWKCSCGNEFWAMPTNVQRGKWCPECKGKKIWETRRKNQNQNNKT